MFATRLQRRLLHHLLIVPCSVALTILVIHLFPKRDFISQLSIGTAYAALFLTAATLLVGPFKVLRRTPNPVSTDLRRDLGIWAGISALLHTAVGLNVHLRGKMWLYFVDAHNHLRRDTFGFANYTGTIAALVFALLLVLSNDFSLRRLGVSRWKSLQRWCYPAVVLTVAHAIAYQHIETRIAPFRVVLYIASGIVLALQIVAALRLLQLKRTS